MGKFDVQKLSSVVFSKMQESESKKISEKIGVCVTNESNFSAVWKLTVSDKYEGWTMEDYYPNSTDATIAGVDLWKKLGGK